MAKYFLSEEKRIEIEKRIANANDELMDAVMEALVGCYDVDLEQRILDANQDMIKAIKDLVIYCIQLQYEYEKATTTPEKIAG